jgi:putative transposase
MAKTQHYYTQFEEGHFYHIYNRTIDKQPMFRSDDNFEFFLKKYDEYLSPVADTFAYCLLGNHFHFLIRVKESLTTSPDLTTFEKLSNLPDAKVAENPVHQAVAHQFRKFFQSYAMAFNKQHQRIGTLFQTPFKRAIVKSDSYFTQLIYYIHSNPQHHNLIDDFRKWKWSSYKRILLDRPSKLKKEEVIDWFGNKQAYQEYHNTLQKIMLDDSLLFENE